MTYNLTHNLIHKEEITSKKIHEVLIRTNKHILDFFNLQQKDLPTQFTSKIIRESEAKIAIVFNAFVYELLKNNNLGKEFIEEAFNLNVLADKRQDLHSLAKELHKKYKINFQYAERYSVYYNQGLSLFLMLLHFDKIIHIPFKFKIPIVKDKEENSNSRKRTDIGINAYPLMLKQIRGLDSQNDSDDDSKFINSANKSILISYGSKLLFALGWINFEDVNIKDIVEFRRTAVEKLGFKNNHPPYAFLISFLHSKNPNDFLINTHQWQKIVTEETKRLNDEKTALSLIENKKPKKADGEELDISFYLEHSKIEKPWENVAVKLFSLKNLSKYTKYLPEYNELIENWIVIENSFIKKTRLESYRGIESALSYLNMYLFFVLPVWYKHNQSKISYPRFPKDLKAGTFISRIVQTNEIKPITLLELIADIQEERKTSNESIYAIIKHLEKFFSFIETYSEELPGCSGFVQPISALDYPKVAKSKGTNKGLIPRHLFSVLVNYIEAVAKYNEVVNDKLLSEEINLEWIESNIKTNVIETLKLQDKIGFVPVISVNKKIVVLKEIPNLLDCKTTSLKDGRILNIHYPHLLNHILVVLQTGLRNNHIQWLDAEKFDSLVKEDGNSFVNLYVNTDKSKTNAWTPIVHRRVIEILRNQLNWRNEVNSLKFNEKKFYNNNPKTKWGQFYPLFSYTYEGLPYCDDAYSKAWMKILIHFQIFLKQTDLKYIELVKLLPYGIKFNEFNLDMKLEEVGKTTEDHCRVRWASDITPHSARVSVVSNYITALPAEIIGQYITGQTEAVVHHYVKLDPNYLTELEKNQADNLNKIAIQNEFDSLSGKARNHPLLADREGSNLSKSMKINKAETIAQYGCVSLNIKEEGKTGITIIMEESNAKLAFNKTEICPYNNNCPPDLIKELKGLRRCGICHFAVRSIDHLPAIAVKKRQVMELLEDIENKLTEADSKENNYSVEELDRLEEERQRITEELLGWIVSEEMLEANRKMLQQNESTNKYVVKKPEILVENLQQISRKEDDIEYLLTRLVDCENFPALDTPTVKAKFDLLRRQLLAKLGDFKKAFDLKLPADPAQECLGLIREVINRYNLTQEQTVALLSTNVLSLEHKNESLLLELK